MSLDVVEEMDVKEQMQTGYGHLAMARKRALDDPAHPYHRRMKEAEKLAQKAYREHKRASLEVSKRMMTEEVSWDDLVDCIMQDRVATAKIIELYLAMVTPEEFGPQMQYAVPFKTW